MNGTQHNQELCHGGEYREIEAKSRLFADFA